jgi:hypothetical protein
VRPQSAPGKYTWPQWPNWEMWPNCKSQLGQVAQLRNRRSKPVGTSWAKIILPTRARAKQTSTMRDG